MSQTLEVLTRRTAATRDIRGIVHTMKTLSAINAHPYEQAAQAIGGWRDTVLDGLRAFVKAHGALRRAADADALPVIVAFGSDQGLCGNYNEIVAEALAAHPAASGDSLILCVGAQMEDAILGAGLDVESALMAPASTDGLNRLARELVTRIDAARAATRHGVVVTLAFTERTAHGQQKPVMRQVLPLAPDLVLELSHSRWTSRSLPHFDMPRDAVLSALLRNYLFASLFRASAEAMVTENAARLARMQQAEKNIDDRLAELATATRTARQSAITEELLDIISGFEALKTRRVRKGDALSAASQPPIVR
ncbi:MAG: F0F1 ATP synthase subunit gamma [Burkholderiales bacterium]|nr:F0F1 ATP synthase subunit gamma [Burkholderiales bacterium]